MFNSQYFSSTSPCAFRIDLRRRDRPTSPGRHRFAEMRLDIAIDGSVITPVVVDEQGVRPLEKEAKSIYRKGVSLQLSGFSTSH